MAQEMTKNRVCFIGAGNMTRAIIAGLINSGYGPEFIQATNPSRPKLDALEADFGVQVSHDNLSAARGADVIVLAVKPQLMEQVCQPLQDIDMSGKLLITIAAGIPAKRYADYLGQDVRLIRVMPNTPMQIGIGMSGAFAPDNISDEQKSVCGHLLASCGEVVWVDKEADLNLVIALAGSSPAYFFLFMDAMIEAGKSLGMDEEKARILVQQAALGAAQMVKQNPDLSPAELKSNVASKGGTTAEALATFEAGNLPALVKSAMQNCIKRAEEMARTF
jgi:pyrroline-5-carboxylate reductase